jgi:hypothetical protein
VQYRVYGPPYIADKLREAFSTASIREAAEQFLERRNSFLAGGSWVANSYERAGKLAAFAHNWPSAGGADYYSDYGHVSNPSGACAWLPRDRDGQLYLRFADGQLVRTRQDWAEFYAVGGAHGPGATTRFVSAWR